MPIEVTLSNEEKVRITAAPKTPAGRPALIEGALRVTVVSGDGSFEPGAGPLDVFLRSGDLPGDTTFVVEADADLGDGEVIIQDIVTLHVTGVMAAALGLSAGTPESK